MRASQTPNKIIKSFYVVGINELKIQRYNITNMKDTTTLRFIDCMDILNSNLNTKEDKFYKTNETWLKVLNNQNVWLRFKYVDNYTDPITDLRLCECDYYSNEWLLMPRNLYSNGYRPIKIIKYQNITDNIKDFPPISPEERSFNKLDDKHILIPSKYNAKNYLNLPTKKNGLLLLISRKTIFLPLKKVIIQRSKVNNNSYSFGVNRHQSPYNYKYLPEVLDTYPINEKNQAVAMFCFPEGVKIKDKFETPKCFSFVLTDEVGERTYGSVFTFMQEISISLKEAFIPSYNELNKTYYYEKAICVLSKYPFYYNCLLFLKEIYNIIYPKSAGKIPVERAICTFVDSLYIQSYDKLLRFNINDKDIDFYRVANYGKFWDTNDKYIDTLFRLLSYEQIITAWQGLLLERKIILLCNSKAALSQIAHALINLIFPFKWIHVYVPILPEKLKLFLDSPVPYIIGISFNIEINELPNDCLILNVNKNCFENYNDKIPPLPPRLNKILMTKLNKLKEQYNLDNPMYVDKYLFNLDEAVIYLGPDMDLFPKIDTCEIKDAFYNVFVNMFKNYEKYFSWLKQSVNLIGTEIHFLKDNFLKDFNSLEKDSFLYLFSETTLFSQISDSLGVEEKNIPSSIAFFLESIKNGKGKNKYFLQNIIPKNVVFAPLIDISDLNNRIFNYPEFPKLNQSLFITHEIPTIPKKSKFTYLADEWCYSTEKFKMKDWPRYFLYLVYDMWFTFFSFVLNIYEDNQAIIMMDYALSLIDYLSNTLKITPTRNLFSKLIKSCGRNCLNPFIKQMLIMIKNINKGKPKFNSLFHNDYLNGLYYLTQNVGVNSLGASLINSNLLMNTLRSTIINKMREADFNVESQLKNIIFISYNICQNCLMTKQITKKMSYDEILSGFINIKTNDNSSICSNCLVRFEPKIYFLEKNQDNLNLKEINFYSPMELIRNIDEIIKNKGEIYFYQKNEWDDTYWNIIFYFELFDLPTCVLYVQNDMEKFEKIKNKLKENKKRKFNKEIKQQTTKKKNFFLGKLNKTNNNIMSDMTMDTSSNKQESINSGNLTDLSANSAQNISGFYSNTEMDIWKNFQLKKQNQKKGLNEINNININNDNKNEINLKLKETKLFLDDIIDYFNNNSQEKLIQFLDKYDQLESRRQHDYVNMCLKKENEKLEKKKTIEKNKNQNNQNQNIKQIPNKNQIFIKEKNEIVQNSGIPKSKTKKDDFSTNTKFNYNIIPKTNQIPNQNNSYLIQNNNINNNPINENDQQINKKNIILNNKTNFNNEHINNMKNYKETHSPKIKKNNKMFIPMNNNNNQILNSSKTNKIKQITLNKNFDYNSNQPQNIINERYIYYNNTENNNNKRINPNQNINKTQNYFSPINYGNNTVNYQSKNKRYETSNTYNPGTTQIPNTSNLQQYNVQDYQANLARQKYNINQVPTYIKNY